MKTAIGSGMLAVLMLMGCVTQPPASSPVTGAADRTVYVTRHMQKQDGPDPSLSAEGAQAADRLAELLKDRGISAIFATATRRAMETAAPVARRTGIRITAYDPGDPQALMTAAAASPGAVLVVGHSNTVHDLVARFGARTPPAPLSEQDYGTVFVVSKTGNVDVVELGQ